MIENNPRRIDNMVAALLPDERTDLVSTNGLAHGWAYQKLANQQAIFRADQKIKRFNSVSILSILL